MVRRVAPKLRLRFCARSVAQPASLFFLLVFVLTSIFLFTLCPGLTLENIIHREISSFNVKVASEIKMGAQGDPLGCLWTIEVVSPTGSQTTSILNKVAFFFCQTKFLYSGAGSTILFRIPGCNWTRCRSFIASHPRRRLTKVLAFSHTS